MKFKTYSNYLATIATTNKILLNKNFLNTFIKIAITESWNNIGSNFCVSTVALLSSPITRKLVLLVFTKFPYCGLLYFW